MPARGLARPVPSEGGCLDGGAGLIMMPGGSSGPRKGAVMIWHRIVPVEFNHCDPAGIVFYPRYFEMTNSVIENFFGEVLDYPFSRMILQDRCGVPTVRVETDFRAPSRLGDRLDFAVEVRRLGRTSAGFRLEARCGGELRLTADLTLVWVTANLKPKPWPDDLRRKITAFMGAP